MKKQFILGLAFLALSFSACEDRIEDPVLPASVGVPSINSVYPEVAISGSHLTIFGQNFGASISENYVTFNGAFSEVMHVEPGKIVTRVPLNLVPGEYTIGLSANGQFCTSKCSIVDLK